MAPSQNKDAPVDLLIKSPNQQVDLKISCDLNWSVGRLKEHLSETYPTKPLKSQQRIIYSGRLLPDHLLLKDVFTQGDAMYTVHLVCPHTPASNQETSPKTQTETNKAEDSNPGASSIPYSSVMSPPLSPHLEGLRQRFPEHQIPNANSFFHSQPYATFDPSTTSGIPPYMAYNLAMMQQTYTQAMAQYFAQNNLNYPNNFPPVYGVPPVQTPPQNMPQQQNAPVVQRQNNLNNQEGQIDILDSMYILTRAVMLLALLYFYSSLGRILFVLTLVMAFLTFRLTADNRNRRVPQVNATNEQPTNEQQAPSSRNQSDVGAQDSDDTQGTASPSESPAEVPASVPSGPSAWSVAVTFLKTFFTSLVPEQQPLTA